MGGDVNKLQPGAVGGVAMRVAQMAAEVAGPPVTEKAFDEYHLYTLESSTTLRARRRKQLKFIHAAGANIDSDHSNGWNWENMRNDHSYGTESNPKIWVMREFVNSQGNHLGMPLPKGRVRFYRRNDDGQVEFTGENMIDHTPKDETIRIYTGNSFDISGERHRTNYTVEPGKSSATETFSRDVKRVAG